MPSSGAVTRHPFSSESPCYNISQRGRRDLAARTLVRTYSLEVDGRLPPGQPAHELGRILAYQRSDFQHLSQPWRCFFEPRNPFDRQRNTVTQTVAVEANKLREKWSIFYDRCSTEEKLDLEKFEPTLDGAIAAITQTMETWNKKRMKGPRGRTSANFHRVCGTLDAHSNALAILPQGNEYFSIFTGSLTTIVQASVQHEKIIEGISEALHEIGDCVRDCTQELELFPTEQMQIHVSNLYGHIFLFFNSIMDWIMKNRYKRMLDSFNQKFNERFKHDIDNIKAQAESVRQIAAQSSRAEVRVSRLVAESSREELRALRHDIRVGLEEFARTHAENVYRDRLRENELAEAKMRQDLNPQMTQLLTSLLTDILEQTRGRSQPLLLNRAPSLASIRSTHQDQPTEYAAEEVIVNSRHCEDFFHRDRVRLVTGPQPSVTISREALQHLVEWTKLSSTSSSLLWLKGDASRSESVNSPLSLFAAQSILLLERARLPVVSYFCELRRGEQIRQGVKTKEQQGLIALGYSLLRQTIELLFPIFSTSADFSEASFARLDGTKGSWHHLIDLLGQLVLLLPNTVYVIIDDMHWLDDRSVDSMTKELISCFRAGKNKLRVLFTTSGRSGILLEHMKRDECVAVDDDALEGYGVVLNRAFEALDL